MEAGLGADQARRLNTRLTLVSALLAISVVGNAALGVAVASLHEVVLVPSLPDTVEVAENGHIDSEYLERLSRDAAYLFLNRTPETAAYFERGIERITEPAVYQGIKNQLVADRQQRIDTRTSQAFFPDEWFVQPDKLYVEVRGNLQISNGTQILSNNLKYYAITFVRRGTTLRLKSFVEIKAQDSKGKNVKPIKDEVQ